MDYEEKRRSKRVSPEDYSISIRPLDPLEWFKFWEGIRCVIRDVSLHGAGIYSADRFNVGMPLSINLRKKNEEKNENANIRIFGKIVWSAKDAEDRYRSGLSFSWWKDDADKKIVNEFIEELAPAE